MILVLLLLPVKVFAQKANAIVGKWINTSGEGQIAIFKIGEKYFGKLVWLKKPDDASGKPQTDKMNIRPGLRERPVLGLEILKDFSYVDGVYDEGTVYDPRSGKIYTCKMQVKGDVLNVKAYVGMFLGKSEVWKRVK